MSYAPWLLVIALMAPRALAESPECSDAIPATHAPVFERLVAPPGTRWWVPLTIVPLVRVEFDSPLEPDPEIINGPLLDANGNAVDEAAERVVTPGAVGIAVPTTGEDGARFRLGGGDSYVDLEVGGEPFPTGPASIEAVQPEELRLLDCVCDYDDNSYNLVLRVDVAGVPALLDVWETDQHTDDTDRLAATRIVESGETVLVDVARTRGTFFPGVEVRYQLHLALRSPDTLEMLDERDVVVDHADLTAPPNTLRDCGCACGTSTSTSPALVLPAGVVLLLLRRRHATAPRSSVPRTPVT